MYEGDLVLIDPLCDQAGPKEGTEQVRAFAGLSGRSSMFPNSLHGQILDESGISFPNPKVYRF